MSSGLYNKVSRVEFARRPYFVDCWECMGFGLLFDNHDDATEDPSAEAAPEPEFGKKATTTSEDDPEATYALTSGRYRMQWNTTDCEQVDFLVSQVDGDFTYPSPYVVDCRESSTTGRDALPWSELFKDGRRWWKQ